ncbi:ATPase [Amycolatopsis rhizosphaerae]|uniref:ATPase n=1 Tax=Amycolatopsis rhizosphaerae TaxID=2053003 RepID=A0A558DDJ8_9PSEU|nr:Clp protease N-terminal domain-containing protein [Amycolatopsis rhizosphaerae]TVT59102.1 ATPase [Amycolatopsis rhizosphaerae]
MFERFTGDARAAVVEAQRDALAHNSPEIAPLQVLTALLRVPDSGARRVLHRLGVPAEEIVAEAERVRRRGGISLAEAEALGEFGIDVDEIVDRIERAHGPNALDAARARPGRRGRVPLTGDAKKTLELSLKELVRAGGKRLGSEHILLALAVLRGPASDVLARFGLDAPRLRQAVS